MLVSYFKKKYSLCFYSWKELVEHWYNFFLRSLVVFTSEATWAWCFLFWKVIINSICILILVFPGGTSDKEPACQCRRHRIYGFGPSISSCNFANCLSRNGPFHLVCQICGHKVSYNIPLLFS